MRSITRLNLQYAHRFLNYEGEAQYLHGHSGTLTIEVEGDVDARTGFVYPCNSIKNIAWSYLKNFDHALILQQEDPLLQPLLDVYVQQGIRDGAPTNTTIGLPIDTELAKAYPECRLVVVKKVATCENLIEIFYDLLKDKFNIKKMTFASADNCASMEF
ncbi:MAG TPA: 6-carboxytetrahydropterin synthase [Candidatus Avacidaminococcus intestinavium]|uniref:6-carboxy-5,6,7,8-tetrahydropterin synthase n=1 Tax=Candidatus Avacidaminococcus intestinavium TaxID=2840684 RepID=A0A9D1MMX0_9FIRM|nr:6-carboxytetrahydropterin synthase [Candidatus Avacidaminococcus intestinavium]